MILDALRGAWTHRRALARCALGFQRGQSRPFMQAIGDMSDDERRRAAIQLMDGAVVEFDRGGLHWRTDTGDEIGQYLYVSGRYEGPELDAVLQHVPAGGTILDLGANIGTTAIPLALAGYSVIAVEPVPSTFAMLSHNVERNGLAHKIRCINAAVVDAPGRIQMWAGFGSGQGEVAVPGREPAMTRWGDKGELVDVDGVPLDALAPDAGVTMVWADVQGHETSVIRTGTRLWASGVPLYLEVDPTSLDLHSGLDSFLSEVTTNFSTFRTRSDLLAGTVAARPITEFAAWVHSIGALGYEDALLGH